MKVRIVQAGYQNFTGEMGHIEFVDGVSVNDLNPDFVRSLGGIVELAEVTVDGQGAETDTLVDDTSDKTAL